MDAQDAAADTTPIWYVAYGSNIAPERLTCYLAGGRPHGSLRGYRGARDPSPPRARRALEARGGLWFAEESTVWGGGVAFAGRLRLIDPAAQTPARPSEGRVLVQGALVTLGQLADIAAQESHATARPLLDAQALGAGATLTIAASWYGRVFGLGRLEGVPVATVTGLADEPARVRPPSRPYVRVIASGLHATRGMDAAAVAAYLAQWPGADAIPGPALAAWCAEGVAHAAEIGAG